MTPDLITVAIEQKITYRRVFDRAALAELLVVEGYSLAQVAAMDAGTLAEFVAAERPDSVEEAMHAYANVDSSLWAASITPDHEEQKPS